MPSVESIIIAAVGGGSAGLDSMSSGNPAHTGSRAEFAARYLAGLTSEQVDLLLVNAGSPDLRTLDGARRALLREAQALRELAPRPWKDRMSVALAAVTLDYLQPGRDTSSIAARYAIAQQHGARLRCYTSWRTTWEPRFFALRLWADGQIGHAVRHIVRQADRERDVA
jgi:FPC/CPF motif-containing protein YcgG